MRRASVVLITLMLVIGLSWSATAEDEMGRGWQTLLDQSGRVLLRTGHRLTPGDLFITPDNREYVVHRTVGTFAYARAVRRSHVAQFAAVETPAEDNDDPDRPPRVAIHHAHSEESYVLSDGEAFADGEGGGIIQVGEALAEALEERGVEVDHSTDSHFPHDAGAYDRSRRTAVQQLEQQPTVMLDVHRDSAPPGAYDTEIDGRQVSQVLLVVGRQNPNVGANTQFARRVKEVTDERYPGLIRGILFARGKYNQDLHPRALLLEVGSHHSNREDAEAAVRLLAETIPEAAGAEPGPGVDPAGRTGLVNAVLLVLVAGLAGGAYLIVATGSPEEAVDRLKRFVHSDLGFGKRRNNGQS